METQKKERSWISFLLVMTLVTVLLGACSNPGKETVNTNKGQQNTSNQANETNKQSTKSNGEQVTLTWWVHDNPAFVEANKKIIQQYKETHPNVTIDLQIFPWDVIIQKLRASFASKNTPDVVQMFGSWVPEYAKNDHLLPVPDETVIKDMYEVALGSYKFQGRAYGVPQESSIEADGMLVHPKMFEDAGIAIPKTWEELKQSARKLTIRDGNAIKVRGFDFISNDTINYQFLAMILQQGADYWAGANKVNFTSPEAVKAMTELVNMVKVDKVTDLTQYETPGAATHLTFFKGQSAMTIVGPWAIADGVNTLHVDKSEYNYVPVPSFTTNPPYFAAKSGWGEVVSKYTKHPDEAWDFVNFMADPARAKQWNEATFTIPSLQSVANDPDFRQGMSIMQTSLDALQYGKVIGDMKDDSFWFKTVVDNFQSMVAGEVSIEHGLKQIEDEINQMLLSKK